MGSVYGASNFYLIIKLKTFSDRKAKLTISQMEICFNVKVGGQSKTIQC